MSTNIKILDQFFGRVKKEWNGDIIENKIESQVKFWSLLGPFVILLSITILLFKVSSHWYLPLSALVGIPVCLKWKMKGLAATLTFLLTSVVLAYSGWELEERYWQIGISLATACSLVILTLSLEEAGGLVGQLQRESQSRLDNFLRLDGQVKNSEQEWGIEKETLQTHVQSLTKELAQVQEDKQTYQKLVLLAKDELITLHVQHERLIEDLNQKKQLIAQLKEKIDESEVTIQSFVNQETEKQLRHVASQLTQTEQALEQMTEQMLLAEEKQAKVEQEEKMLRKMNEELNKTLDSIKKENAVLSATLSQVQNDYEQTCQLEKQKSHELEKKLELLRDLQEKALQKEQALQKAEGHNQQWDMQFKQMKQKLELYHAQLEEQAQQLSTQRLELDQTQLKEESWQKALQQHQDQIKQLNECCQQIEEHKDLVEMDFEAAKRKQQQLEQEISKTKQALETFKEQFKHQSEQLLQKTQALLEAEQKEILWQQQLQNYQNQLQEIKHDRHQIAEQRKQLENELEQAKKNPVQIDAKGIAVEEPKTQRRVEAMYAQLKTQFQEKSTVLDATRRELFHTQEQLLALQKDWQEEKTFEWSETERQLQKQFNQITNEFERTSIEYEEEVESLHKLVADLLKQVVKK